MEEKTFKITQCKSGEIPEILTLKESELTESHKDLFYGNLINEFNKSPDEVKIRFLQNLERALNNDMQF